MAGYPPNPGSGYPYGGAGGGYGAPPPPYGSSPAPSAPPYGEKPPKEGKTSSSAPYYGGGGGYGAPPSTQPYGSGGGYGAPPSTQPQSYGGGGGGGYGAPPSSQPYGAPYGAPPPSSAPYGAPGGYGSPFASLVPSAFPPGTDPNVVACFQAADRDGSGMIDDKELQSALSGGMIDDKELQSALSGYNQSFSLRTVHLLMYLFTNTNVRKIGPKEFTSVFYSLQNWRSIFERFDRDRSGKIDATELRDALLSLGYSVSPTVLDLLVSKFDKTGGKNKAIEYDNFIECCLTVKGLTEKFKEKDTAFSGSATFTYEAFMLTVLPFLIA
uniref:EF-hand domain-containing protein n=1 Tax=Oryza punctata TaxID=4537 RepID=A0A0E0MJF6_ORYPU